MATVSKRTLGARNRLPVDLGRRESCEFLALSEEPLGKDEALSEHYLDYITGPALPCTRTRSRSHSGPPPEWMRGAHGEQVKVKSASGTGYPSRRRRKLKSKVPETGQAKPEDSSINYYTKAADAITDRVSPQTLEIANALVTILGIAGSEDISNMSDEMQRRAVEELMRMSKDSEVDPFEGIEALQAVLFKAGYSIPEVAMIVQHMRVQLVRLAFEEYTGGGSQLESMMKMCDEVREMCSRSEFIINTYLPKVRTGAYEALVDRIEAVDTIPRGLEEAQEKVLASIADFHNELLQFGSLLWKSLRYEKQIAREIFDQVREEALAAKRADDCEVSCYDFTHRREQMKCRLEDRYMAFHNAHMRIHTEIQRMNQAAEEQEANNMRQEEDIDEWQRRLNLLLEQKERRDGNNKQREKVMDEQMKDLRLKLQMKVSEMGFIRGEMDDLKGDIEKSTLELESTLTDICTREWHDKLLDHCRQAAEHRETKALTIEDLLVAQMRLNKQLDVEKLKQAVREKRKELGEHSDMKRMWESRVKQRRHQLEFALVRMMDLERWLQCRNQPFKASHSDGTMIHAAPLTTPLMLRRIFEILMTRAARRRHCMGDWLNSSATKTSESPAGHCQQPAVAIGDMRRAAREAPSNTAWRVCLVSSFSVPSLSLDGVLKPPPCTPCLPRLGVRSYLWQAATPHNCQKSETQAESERAHAADSHQPGRRRSDAHLSPLTRPFNTGRPKSPKGANVVRKCLGLFEGNNGTYGGQALHWRGMQDRWKALWSSAEELCRGDVAFMGDIAHSRKSSVPRPWTRQMCARIQSVILDGYSCVQLLEQFESALAYAEQLKMNDLVVNLEYIEEEVSDHLGIVLRRQWARFAEWAAACEERQRSVATVMSIFTEIQSRLEALGDNLTLLGSQAEDFGFAARMLDLNRRAGDGRTAATLHEQQLTLRFVAIGLVNEAQTLRAEADALLDPGGYIASMQTKRLCTQELKQQASLFMNALNDSLQARANEIKGKIQAEKKRIEEEKKRASIEEAKRQSLAAEEARRKTGDAVAVSSTVKRMGAAASGEGDTGVPKAHTDTDTRMSLKEKEEEKPAILDKAMMMKFNKAMGKTKSFQLSQVGDSASGKVVISKAGERDAQRKRQTEKGSILSHRSPYERKRTMVTKHEPPPLFEELFQGDGPFGGRDSPAEQHLKPSKLQAGGAKVRSLIEFQRAGKRRSIETDKSPRQHASAPDQMQVAGASPDRKLADSVKMVTNLKRALRRGSSRNSSLSASSASIDSSRSQSRKDRAQKQDTVATDELRGRSLAQADRDGTLSPELVEMLKQPGEPLASGKRHQVSTEREDGTQNLSASLTDYDSIEDLIKNEGDDSVKVPPQPIQSVAIHSPPPEVQVKRRTSPDTRGRMVMHTHIVDSSVEGDTAVREMAGNHLEPLLLPWVKVDPALLQIGRSIHEAQEVCPVESSMPDGDLEKLPSQSPTSPLPEFAPRDPLEQPTGWDMVCTGAESSEDQQAHQFAAGARQPIVHVKSRAARPSSAGQPVQPSAGEQELIEFDDVDVPLDLPERAPTPSWILDLVRQVESATPSLDVPGLRAGAQMMPEVASIPSNSLETGEVPSVASTPLPPPLAYGSYLFGAHTSQPSSPSSRGSRKTPLFMGLEYQQRLSKNLWLPTSGADADKACSSRLPPSLARKLGVDYSMDYSNKSLSPERAGSVERQQRKDGHSRVHSPQRPCTVEPCQLPQWRANSSAERPAVDRPSTSMAGPISSRRAEEVTPIQRPGTGMSGFIASMGGSSASRVPASLPNQRPPSSILSRPPSSARGRTQCSVQDPLPSMLHADESTAYSSSLNRMSSTPQTVRTGSSAANWLPEAHAEAGRNIDSALSMASHDMPDATVNLSQLGKKSDKVHVLARGFCTQVRSSVKFGAKPHPSLAVQEHRSNHSRNSIVRATQYI